jgi:hypothetical protein
MIFFALILLAPAVLGSLQEQLGLSSASAVTTTKTVYFDSCGPTAPLAAAVTQTETKFVEGCGPSAGNPGVSILGAALSAMNSGTGPVVPKATESGLYPPAQVSSTGNNQAAASNSAAPPSASSSGAAGPVIPQNAESSSKPPAQVSSAGVGSVVSSSAPPAGTSSSAIPLSATASSAASATSSAAAPIVNIFVLQKDVRLQINGGIEVGPKTVTTPGFVDQASDLGFSLWMYRDEVMYKSAVSEAGSILSNAQLTILVQVEPNKRRHSDQD